MLEIKINIELIYYVVMVAYTVYLIIDKHHND